jgi:hypothetical protein
MYVVLHRCFSHSAQQIFFPSPVFSSERFIPEDFTNFCHCRAALYWCWGPVSALAVYDNSTMWPLKVEKRKATAAAAPRSHKKKEMSIFRFDVSTVFGDGGKCPAVQLFCIYMR